VNPVGPLLRKRHTGSALIGVERLPMELFELVPPFRGARGAGLFLPQPAPTEAVGTDATNSQRSLR
jgi:hypothetical protein